MTAFLDEIKNDDRIVILPFHSVGATIGAIVDTGIVMDMSCNLGNGVGTNVIVVNSVGTDDDDDDGAGDNSTSVVILCIWFVFAGIVIVALLLLLTLSELLLVCLVCALLAWIIKSLTS